jgi:hypothetical protein
MKLQATPVDLPTTGILDNERTNAELLSPNPPLSIPSRNHWNSLKLLHQNSETQIWKIFFISLL